MIAHLSALVAYLAGALTFLGPLIVWLIKKDQSRFIDYHAKEALNFNISVVIYLLASIVVAVVTCGWGAILTAGVVVFSIVMAIIAGLKANNGEYYQYPVCLRLIK